MTPIHKTTTVPLTPAEAFDLFIRQIDSWWPKDSHAPLGPDSTLTVAPRTGGAITEIAPDGTTNLWGRIIAYDPGTYLEMTWFPDGDEEDATVVAVSFHAVPEGTRLDLTITDARSRTSPVDAVSTSYLFGWDLVLGSYAFVALDQKVTDPAA